MDSKNAERGRLGWRRLVQNGAEAIAGSCTFHAPQVGGTRFRGRGRGPRALFLRRLSWAANASVTIHASGTWLISGPISPAKSTELNAVFGSFMSETAITNEVLLGGAYQYWRSALAGIGVVERDAPGNCRRHSRSAMRLCLMRQGARQRAPGWRISSKANTPKYCAPNCRLTCVIAFEPTSEIHRKMLYWLAQCRSTQRPIRHRLGRIAAGH